MVIYVGNTDISWYNYLRNIAPEDVNFWQPGGKTNFRILSPGAPFLFRLKSPINKIGGVGFFTTQSFLPLNVAWDVFGKNNGCDSFDVLKSMILKYRADKVNSNPNIGCIVLTNPVFFQKEDWIDVPENWSKSIVQGKSYDTVEGLGLQLWSQVEAALSKYLDIANEGEKSQLILEDTESPRYSNSILKRVRLGQNAFRILVTDAYGRKCSISGERTLPVLEAAHIKPYSFSGPHFISNGLLLRSDIHKLFDAGYITITNEYKVEVSKKIKEEFENGREYYKFHGKILDSLPIRDLDRPHTSYLQWHNQHFKG